MKKSKIVYVPLAVDILHSGHLNIIEKAKKYGKVVIGLLSDSAVAEYKNIPSLEYSERYRIVKSLKNVSKIIKQESWDYSKILNSLKPDFFVHGDDWKEGIQKKTRYNVINLLKKNKGRLIEIPYTKNISSSSLQESLFQNGLINVNRQNYFRRLLQTKELCRILETHSPLSALIAEKIFIKKKTGEKKEFDGFWSS